jgi:hypothetical protein
MTTADGIGQMPGCVDHAKKGSPSSVASLAVVRKLRKCMVFSIRLRSGERDAHAAVDLALFLDSGHRGVADFAGAPDMRPPQG